MKINLNISKLQINFKENASIKSYIRSKNLERQNN